MERAGHAISPDVIVSGVELYVEWFLITARRLHASFFFITTSRVVAAISAMKFSASLLTALILIQQHNRLSHQNNPAEVVSFRQFGSRRD